MAGACAWQAKAVQAHGGSGVRIVIPVLSLHRGGGPRVVVESANQLVERGHDVTVVMLEGQPIAYPLKCPVKRVKQITPAVIPEADVIMPNFWPTVKPAAESGKGRVVRFSTGFEPLWVPQKEEALATYLQGFPVITLGSHHRRIIREATGQDCFVAQPGVDDAVFRPLKSPTGRGRTVFFIYRSERHGYFYKGNRDFSAAIQLVRRHMPDVMVQVAVTESGESGAEPPSFPFPFTPLHLADDRAMAAAYNGAAVYVLASWFEALSLPPLEAMACGTPAVVTDCGGVRDYARHGENCLLCPPKRPDLLAGYILSALRDAQLRSRLIEGGLRTAAVWTWERFGDQLESALRQIMQGKVQPDPGT